MDVTGATKDVCRAALDQASGRGRAKINRAAEIIMGRTIPEQSAAVRSHGQEEASRVIGQLAETQQAAVAAARRRRQGRPAATPAEVMAPAMSPFGSGDDEEDEDGFDTAGEEEDEEPRPKRRPAGPAVQRLLEMQSEVDEMQSEVDEMSRMAKLGDEYGITPGMVHALEGDYDDDDDDDEIDVDELTREMAGKEREIRTELDGLNLNALFRRALAAGVDEGKAKNLLAIPDKRKAMDKLREMIWVEEIMDLNDPEGDELLAKIAGIETHKTIRPPHHGEQGAARRRERAEAAPALPERKERTTPKQMSAKQRAARKAELKAMTANNLVKAAKRVGVPTVDAGQLRRSPTAREETVEAVLAVEDPLLQNIRLNIGKNSREDMEQMREEAAIERQMREAPALERGDTATGKRLERRRAHQLGEAKFHEDYKALLLKRHDGNEEAAAKADAARMEAEAREYFGNLEGNRNNPDRVDQQVSVAMDREGRRSAREERVKERAHARRRAREEREINDKLFGDKTREHMAKRDLQVAKQQLAKAQGQMQGPDVSGAERARARAEAVGQKHPDEGDWVKEEIQAAKKRLAKTEPLGAERQKELEDRYPEWVQAQRSEAAAAVAEAERVVKAGVDARAKKEEVQRGRELALKDIVKKVIAAILEAVSDDGGDELRRELTELKLSELRERALALGVDEDLPEMEAADQVDTASSESPPSTDTEAAPLTRLTAETVKKIDKLYATNPELGDPGSEKYKAAARKVGCTPIRLHTELGKRRKEEEVAKAKGGVVDLILEAVPGALGAALHREILTGLKLSELRKRARALGVDKVLLEEADYVDTAAEAWAAGVFRDGWGDSHMLNTDEAGVHHGFSREQRIQKEARGKLWDRMPAPTADWQPTELASAVMGIIADNPGMDVKEIATAIKGREGWWWRKLGAKDTEDVRAAVEMAVEAEENGNEEEILAAEDRLEIEKAEVAAFEKKIRTALAEIKAARIRGRQATLGRRRSQTEIDDDQAKAHDEWEERDTAIKRINARVEAGRETAAADAAAAQAAADAAALESGELQGIRVDDEVRGALAAEYAQAPASIDDVRAEAAARARAEAVSQEYGALSEYDSRMMAKAGASRVAAMERTR